MTNVSNSSEEIWKDVKGYEGYYQISNFGNIRALDRWIKNGPNGKQRLQYGEFLKPRDNSYGYYMVGISKNRTYKMFAIHRLVAIAFIPNPDNLREVNHRDGNKLNNHVDNLEWCTRSHNVKHAYRSGLKKAHARNGIDNPMAKLTDSQVYEIRAMIADNRTNAEIAKKYNVCRASIIGIKYGRKWKHLL